MIISRRNLILAASAGIFVPRYGKWFNRLREPQLPDFTVTMTAGHTPFSRILLERSLDNGVTWQEVDRISCLRQNGLVTVDIHPPLGVPVPSGWQFRAYRKPLPSVSEVTFS